MSEPVVSPLPNRGGRPKKYQSLEERKAALKLARIAKRETKNAVADLPPLPPVSGPLDLQAAIARATATLSVPDAVFVGAVCSGSSHAEAYKLAHPTVTDDSAKSSGSKQLHKPEIAKALAEVKQALAANVAYDFNAFMAEMDRAIAFAHATRNATAMVRAVELKGKATGSLSDKPLGATGSGFTLNIIGVESPPTLERADG
jgi:hypothetical protein